MRKKAIPPDEPVVPERILELAKAALVTDRAQPPVRKCSVCGSDCAPSAAEDLCWVCRRLKISAWGDSDHQMPAQE